MRLAIISDTHMPRGTRALPEPCVEQLRGADVILHAGDWIAPEVVELVRSFGPPVQGIHGNVDGDAVRALVPAQRTVSVAGVRIGMVHAPGPAARRFERLRAAFLGTDAVVFGHTHMPQHEARDGFQIFNPGSPTERRRAPAHTMGIAIVEDGQVEFQLLAVA